MEEIDENKLYDEIKDNGYKDYNDMIRQKVINKQRKIMKDI